MSEVPKIEAWTVNVELDGKSCEIDSLAIVSADSDLPTPKNDAGDILSAEYWAQRVEWLKKKYDIDVSPSQAYAIFKLGRLRWESAKKSFDNASELAFGITPTPGASETGK